MTAFLIVLHVLVCVFLILFVLLQPGARGGVGSAFGGAGGQTVFGGRGANTFLAKLTAAAAVIFMITSISLSYFVSHNTSVMKARAQAAAQEKDEEKKDEAKPEENKDAAPAPAADGSAPAPAPAAATTGEAPAPEKPAGDPPPAP